MNLTTVEGMRSEIFVPLRYAIVEPDGYARRLR